MYLSWLYENQDNFTTLIFNNREEWLKGRKKGIGGSDASAVLCMNPYKSNYDLWLEKTGRKSSEIADNQAMEYGRKAEDSIRQIYALDRPSYEVHYLNNVTLQSKTHLWALYSPDGLLYDKEAKRKGVLEIKTSTILCSVQREKWADGNIPQNYYVQILQGLLVTGFDFVELRAHLKYSDDYTKVVTYHYERQDLIEDLKVLEEEEKKLWDCVKNNKRPSLKIDL